MKKAGVDEDIPLVWKCIENVLAPFVNELLSAAEKEKGQTRGLLPSHGTIFDTLESKVKDLSDREVWS